MMLFISGVEYTNKYVSQQEWGTLKQDTENYPTGSLPIVKINDKRYFQTMATLRSLAMGLGLYDPEDLRGCYVNDCIMDSYSTVMDKAGAVAFAPDHEKEEAMKSFLGQLH